MLIFPRFAFGISAPAGLTATCVADHPQVTLSWSPVSGASYYSIRFDTNEPSWDGTFWDAKCTDSGSYSCGDYCQNKVFGTSITLYINYNSGYRWWVHARDASGNWSDVEVKYFACTKTPPLPPTDIGAVCSPDGKNVTLSWSPPASGVSYYAIRLDGNPLSWSDLDWCDIYTNSNKCTDSGSWSGGDYCQNNIVSTQKTLNIQPGTPYWWWIHSVNNITGGGSVWSAAVGGFFSCLPPPTNAIMDWQI